VEIEPQSLLTAWGIGQTVAAASAWEEACEWFRRAVDAPRGLRSAWADFSLMWFLWTAFHRTDAARDPNFLEYDFEPEMSSEQPGQSCTFGYVAYQE
jgi:hypothetical protein